MKNLDLIAEELFNKVRGRFPSISIGTADGKVTNQPKEARFFDFDFSKDTKESGRITISLDEKNIAVMYSNNFLENQLSGTKQDWYNFLKELRSFAKKRMLDFDTRDINKSNLNKRDFEFLAQTRTGDETMTETKMYGTSKTSYQDLGNARIAVKHKKAVNADLPAGRTQNIHSLYIESADGERFKYPYKHLNGARAMARHVSEGGKPFDEFGEYIVSLSEEMYKLRKFKNYMSRSSVMAEGLRDYVGPVNERIETVKDKIFRLQKESYYKEAVSEYEKPVLEDVPEDVAENWIDQLTIKQFNEELKDVFPYIYKLVSEVTKAKELGPEDILSERTEDDLMTAYERGGESQLARALGITTDQLDDEINEVGYERGLHADDDREDIILDIIRDHADDNDMSMADYDGMTAFENEDNNLAEIENVIDDLMGQFSETKDLPSKRTKKRFEKIDDKILNTPVTGIYDSETGEKIFMKPQSIRSLGTYWVMKGSDSRGRAVMEIDPEQESALKRMVPVQEMMTRSGMLCPSCKGSGRDERTGRKCSECTGTGKLQGLGEDSQIPVREFVLSMFDRETGKFPKGETAVLTAIEKDYGEQYINPVKEFIEAINSKFGTVLETNKEEGINKIKMLYLQNQASDMASQDSIYAPGVKGAPPAGDVDKQAAMIAKKYGITDQELMQIRMNALQSDADMMAMERIKSLEESNKEEGINKIKMLYMQNQASGLASQDSIYAPGVKGAAPEGDVDKQAAMIAKKYGITDQELMKIRLDALQSDADMLAMERIKNLAGI